MELPRQAIRLSVSVRVIEELRSLPVRGDNRKSGLPVRDSIIVVRDDYAVHVFEHVIHSN